MKEELINLYSSELSTEQKQVFNILVMPIKVNNRRKEKFHINYKEGVLFTRHTYNSSDPDMSDIAIEFYKIIYDIDILDEKGKIANVNLAGDTMNSYNTIARFAKDEVKIEWYNTYHCLANFWILPIDVGRRTTMNSKNSSGRYSDPITVDSFNSGRRDYMDRFLEDMHCNDLIDFANGHFIDGVYFENNKVFNISKIYGDCTDYYEAANSIINNMKRAICARAVKIVVDKDKCEKLYELFVESQLIKECKK